MPWRARLGGSASLPASVFASSLGVVVVCVAILTAAPGTSAAAGRTGDASVPTPSSPAQAAASPSNDAALTVSPGPVPTASPKPTRSVAPAPTERPAAGLATSPGVNRAATAFDRAIRRKLRRILRNTVDKQGIAGLSVAVRSPDGNTWTGVAGHAEITPDRPIEPDTVFAIASVTKTFVAALILQLAEEGKVDLDAPFGTYFTDAPRKDTVTLRQLLSHTSGIYDYFANPRYLRISGWWLDRARSRGLADREHRWTYAEIMRLVEPGYCKPGECYHYSNTNYVILGKVAARVGGAPLHQLLRERFFDPLGMADTVYQPAELPPDDAAHGHWSSPGGGHIDHTRDAEVIPFMAAVSAANAAGAIASTPRDLVIWADALYGGDLLSRRSLREMRTILPAGTYGLGTDVATFAGHRGFGHRGGLRGFEASVWHFAKEGVSVALLSNQGNWLTDLPMERIVKAVLGKG
jgi:D-alanyl-D-alanine carboxypeptidase